MGVKELWALLRSEGLVTQVQGGEDHPQIVREVQGKVVAVDLSQWFFQANFQPELLANFPTQEARCLKLSFERAINFLRYECVPVGCLDGDVPPEKRELLQKRCLERSGYVGGGNGNSAFQELGNLVGQLLRALGLPVVPAPGEAEALMAALEVAGLVDACATSDGDALVFGATHIYHTLRLQTMVTKQSEVVRVDMEGIRGRLGLRTGGAEALLALALITGGDYDASGLDSVGKTGALRIIRHLLKGRASDEGIVTRLADALAQAPDTFLESLTKCTGCRHCKHASGLKGHCKHHSGRNPCPTCQLREGPCQCPFHAREEERRLNKVVRLANQNPGFPARAAAAYKGYRSQRSGASIAVSQLPQQRLKWQQRPDVAKAAGLLGVHLEWEPEKVRRKLLPLLLTWDAEQRGHAEAEFEPVRIVKLHGAGYGTEPQKDAWRYLMEWKRLSKGSQQDINHDTEWLTGKGTCTPDARSLRIDVVAHHWPALLAKFNTPAPAKPVRRPKKGLKEAEVRGMASRMQAFLTPARKDAAPADKAGRAPLQGRGLAEP
ncbi:hypothetical protein WJX73_005755 [Symbiochloris irregularis]|uniref:XPG-I domain-containing protein n=1 Tax=Symbiochloris irregularis TaxID=706552 RepID=A0AAW1PVV7_9CHLO